MKTMKVNNKVIMGIELVLAAISAITICGAFVYIDQHPFKAMLTGFDVSDVVPVVIAGFIAATVVSTILVKVIAAIKAAVDKKKKSKKRKAKKAAK